MTDLLQLASQPAVWAALATLVVMEVVLGIDNLIFISIVTNKLPEAERSRARRLGIGLALILRLALLGTVAWIVFRSVWARQWPHVREHIDVDSVRARLAELDD